MRAQKDEMRREKERKEARGEHIPRSSKVPDLRVKKHLGSGSRLRNQLILHGQG